MRNTLLSITLSFAAVWLTGAARADETSPYPTAIFPFQERGADVKGLGTQVADLVFASLAVDPGIYLVDREDMAKVLQEQELSVSGVVAQNEAVQVGQLTGAKLIVTGSVIQAGDKLVLVAKIIGAETSRVAGASVKGDVEGNLDELVEELAAAVIQSIGENSETLVPKPVSQKDRIAAIKKKLGDGKLPVVKVSIAERQVGQTTIDPAAETEMAFYLESLGFEVLDVKEAAGKKADVEIVGEGFSEFTSHVGKLAPVKARLEVKAIDVSTGRVLAIDRQTAVAIDLNEQIAGKAALQDASAKIAARLLPKLVAAKK